MRAPNQPGIPRSSLELLAAAATELQAAVVEPLAGDRYVRGHLAARRTAAAVLAARARPAAGGPRDVWSVLASTAPELGEWAAFFTSGTPRRVAAKAGLPVVSAREADDLIRDVHRFLDLAVTLLARGATTIPLAG